MNPLYQQFGPKPTVQPNMLNNLSSAIQQARQVMGMVRNPQQYVLQNLQNMGIMIPPEIQGDPDQITRYLLNNVPLSPELKQLLGLR